MIIENSNKIEVALHEASYYQLINALSYSYYMSRYNEMDLEVDVLWSKHFVDDNFYFNNWDEPESFLEKFNYLHSMMEFKANVDLKFNHRFTDNWNEYQIQKLAFEKRCKKIRTNILGFEYDAHSKADKRTFLWPLKNNLKRVKNKVTFWKPTFVHKMMGSPSEVSWYEKGRNNDNLYTYKEYESIKKNLQSLGYYVQEVEYRTPVREMYYHLATCEFAFGFVGVCQSLSICLSTPTIMTKFKISAALNYDHLLTKVSVDMFKDKRYIDQNVQIAKQKVSVFRDFYENFFGE